MSERKYVTADGQPETRCIWIGETGRCMKAFEHDGDCLFPRVVRFDGGYAKRLMDEKLEAGRRGYEAAKQPPHGPIYEAAVRYHAAIRAWQASEGGRAQTEEANAATEALRAMDKAMENFTRGVAGEPIDPSAMLSALDPAEPVHLSVESERRLAAVAQGMAYRLSTDPPLTAEDVSQAMDEIKSLRTRLRAAVGSTDRGTGT